MQRVKPALCPIQLDLQLTVRQALERVSRLPSVASKRYLTNKVQFPTFGIYMFHELYIFCYSYCRIQMS